MRLRTALKNSLWSPRHCADPGYPDAGVRCSDPANGRGFCGRGLITFDGIPDGAPVNGMTVDGVQFNYFVNNVASNALVVDGGPGMTKHVSRPNT